jgi:hypothetical protein
LYITQVLEKSTVWTFHSVHFQKHVVATQKQSCDPGLRTAHSLSLNEAERDSYFAASLSPTLFRERANYTYAKVHSTTHIYTCEIFAKVGGCCGFQNNVFSVMSTLPPPHSLPPHKGIKVKGETLSAAKHGDVFLLHRVETMSLLFMTLFVMQLSGIGGRALIEHI